MENLEKYLFDVILIGWVFLRSVNIFAPANKKSGGTDAGKELCGMRLSREMQSCLLKILFC